MKKIILLLATIVAAQSAFAQNFERLQKMRAKYAPEQTESRGNKILLEKVESYTANEFTFEIEEDPFNVKKYTYYTDGNIKTTNENDYFNGIVTNEEFFYDAKGNVAAQITSGSFNNKSALDSFFYDAQNRLKKKITRSLDFQKELSGFDEYTYDGKNKTFTQMKQFGMFFDFPLLNNQIDNKLAGDNILISEKSFFFPDSKVSVAYITENIYNKDNLLEKKTLSSKVPDSLTTSVIDVNTYAYYDNKALKYEVKNSYFDKATNTFFANDSIFYKYNTTGKIQKIEYFYRLSGGLGDYDEEYIYNYDKNQNIDSIQYYFSEAGLGTIYIGYDKYYYQSPTSVSNIAPVSFEIKIIGQNQNDLNLSIIDEKDNAFNIFITDLTGRTITAKKVSSNQTNTLNIPHNGIFCITAINEKGQIKSIKYHKM
jgi:hypothetical protein